MIEIPECYVLAEQINQTLAGKVIEEAEANTHPHAFAWYSGDPADYAHKLKGKRVTEANPGTGYTCGGNTEMICEDRLLVMSTPIKYHPPGAKLPAKHQLLLRFEDGSHMSCTVQMWGAMFCYQIGADDLPEGYKINKSPTPYDEAFDMPYFMRLRDGIKKNISVKAFLATEQRIPGFGNGVLHDVLFNAKIHPKRKLETLTEEDFKTLFDSVKKTLNAMKESGGRDTEKDLHGNPGGYKTILSSKRIKNPCPVCGDMIAREAYMGGNIYYCMGCQRL